MKFWRKEIKVAGTLYRLFYKLNTVLRTSVVGIGKYEILHWSDYIAW
jgi:hypothetical protein